MKLAYVIEKNLLDRLVLPYFMVIEIGYIFIGKNMFG
jgi:hypothetical protein